MELYFNNDQIDFFTNVFTSYKKKKKWLTAMMTEKIRGECT